MHTTFKQAVNELILAYEQGQRRLQHGKGLCFELSKNGVPLSYRIMRGVLTDNQYLNESLGAYGSFTERRYIKLKQIQKMSKFLILRKIKNYFGKLDETEEAMYLESIGE